jgi:hypothetical protein
MGAREKCPKSKCPKNKKTVKQKDRNYKIKNRFVPGLPDFSWCMMPKPEKCTK